MSKETKTLLAIGAATLIILFGGIFLMSRSNKSSSNTSQVPANSQLLVRSDSYKTATDSASAKVTVVEFGDFECPACQEAHPVTKQMLKDYDGKVNFVFRNFPLPQHTKAQISSEAAEAAGAQDKYWEMYDKIYENPGEWENSESPLDVFSGYAKDIGLDVTKFENDVKANKFSNKIQQDMADGIALGINSTPTFYINGQQMVGVPDYSQLKQVIDKALGN
ncbi:DsbA family protein [Patescibacteria group bacterium]|nr:DsbA family protein [Patescibacteria group bacterium]